MAKPPKKIEGSGNCLKVTNAAGALIEVVNLITVGRAKINFDAIDVTDQKSGRIAEFISGKGTPQPVTIEFYHDPGSDQDELLTELHLSQEVRPYQIIEATSRDGETSVTDGEWVLLDYSPDAGPIGDSWKGSMTFQPSGLATRTVGT